MSGDGIAWQGTKQTGPRSQEIGGRKRKQLCPFVRRCDLDKECRANWFRQSGGTPEVVGSIPERGEFPPPVKKTLSSASYPKHCEAGLTHKATAPRVRVGQGFGGFLDML